MCLSLTRGFWFLCRGEFVHWLHSGQQKATAGIRCIFYLHQRGPVESDKTSETHLISTPTQRGWVGSTIALYLSLSLPGVFNWTEVRQMVLKWTWWNGCFDPLGRLEKKTGVFGFQRNRFPKFHISDLTDLCKKDLFQTVMLQLFPTQMTFVPKFRKHLATDNAEHTKKTNPGLKNSTGFSQSSKIHFHISNQNHQSASALNKCKLQWGHVRTHPLHVSRDCMSSTALEAPLLWWKWWITGSVNAFYRSLISLTQRMLIIDSVLLSEIINKTIDHQHYSPPRQ